MLLTSSVANVASLMLLNQAAGAFLSIATIIRTIIFFLYNKFNLKPSIATFATFEIGFIIIAGITWNSYYDILFLFAVSILTIVTWQDNMFVLRVGMILNSAVLIVYDILIGAYINTIGKVFCLVAAVIAIIYYDVYKRTTPIMKFFYGEKPKLKRRRLWARLKKNRVRGF